MEPPWGTGEVAKAVEDAPRASASVTVVEVRISELAEGKEKAGRGEGERGKLSRLWTAGPRRPSRKSGVQKRC